ncbi:RelA/SpoT family protein [Scleromatobacter humisilvae]|uniref:GTP pyrophosphokinase n=1 Tax=Scleromatobacter humisilvae TaxID=2897159 RepID=A0A9X1YHD9_9BURK|nr:bifunctional (p)ppGpp synthetase/guanosine-3',5'-bis(diphosphate) 3'-pyrophosphohydrolase [Scleromatobacter humisilvae]MCK9686514.1 bifunctional (p)ppGpp synthetase/guanosine-3',5'-bis(diphosphate) 3'-pyrophosphohydrolase [Scleromatobacter humisilvae]
MKTQASNAAVVDAPAILRVADADMALAATEPHAGSEHEGGDADALGADALVRARAFAQPLLVGRLLDTGEEAWTHAAGVAQILADLGATPAMQAAAWLVYAGDGLQRPIEVVTKAFGPSYASLVDLTRKLVKIQRAAREAQIGKEQRALQTERVRKMLLAFSRDLRVVLLRLASRLQTLRWHAASRTPCPPELARESQQVFAPLANRLGIWQIKWELEDLSFRFLEPAEYKRIAKLLDERRVEREAGIDVFRAQLEQMLAAAGIRADIQGRPKHIYSIWKKMRGKELDFEHVFDIRAVRVIVDDVAACYAVLGRVNERYRAVDGEFDDYIARPKGNGYQSLHTVVKDDAGRAFEVQIRTREMHEHAEHGVAAHWAYKEAGSKGYGGTSSAGAAGDQVAAARKAVLRQLLAWERDFVAEPELGAEAPAEAAAFEDRIYVFTPQASVIELPAGGTPVDFAYSLHTDVGHRCRGARVDGQMVPLQTPLQNGQTVEIITVREGGPSMDWLNPELHFLQSHRARAKVRAWFNALQHAQTVAKGRELVEKLLQREGRTATSLEELAGKLGFDDAQALFEVVGKDEYSLRNIENLLRPAEPPPPDEVIQLKRPRTGGAAGGVLVVGIDSLLTTLASCCRPAPPDAIGGYVTRGKGVAVHRTDCTNFRHMASTTPERVIPVEWGLPASEGRPDRSVYAVDVVVEAQDRQGLLRDISDVLAKQKVNVIGVSSQSTKGIGDRRAFMTFTVEIDSAERLGQVLGLVAKVPGVDSARRR